MIVERNVDEKMTAIPSSGKMGVKKLDISHQKNQKIIYLILLLYAYFNI